MKQGWEIKKLGEVCDILNGYAFKSEKYTSEGVRVLRITNVQKGYVVDDDPKFYPKDEMANLQQYILKENDLLMSLTGNVGRVGLLQNEMLPAALNQRVACLRIKNEQLNINYLFHFLNSDKFENDAIFSASGIAQKNMSTEWLKKYTIPVPPREEQERIVAELDCLSGVIERKHEQLRELDALAQSIFYQMFGAPITNEKGWKVKKLEEVCDVCSSRRVFVDELVEDGVPFYRGTEIGQMAEGEIIIPTLYITPDHYERLKEETGIPQIGDLLLPSICNDGRIWLVSTDAPYYFKDGRVLWIKCAGKIDGQFLRYQLKNIFINNYNKIASGTTFAELKIFILRELKINIPPLSFQQEFADKIEAIEKQKELIKKSISETETLFNARMDYYFN